MITTILFDLDGTLLPMDLDEYLACYFQLLIKKLIPYGYDPKTLTAAIEKSVTAMVENNGSRTNEAAFWDTLIQELGPDAVTSRPLLDNFYQEAYQQVKQVCGYLPEARDVIRFCRKKGLRVVLATSPLYPRIATESRICWAGLEPEDFDFITTYEDSHYCKPNPDYYREILAKLNLTGEECLMVGNDVREDMVAKEIGLSVFLLPANLINKEGKDISQYPQGTIADLMIYLEKILG